MKNAIINRGIIKKIAQALGELNEQVVYVGGATVGLYINDPAADDVRPTKDVDISVAIASLGELENIRVQLLKKGFVHAEEQDIICRFHYEDVMVDVMNTKAIGWAPANPWFAPGFELKESINIDSQRIDILPLPYFLSSKFAAYNDRGHHDPRTSHDFEDIVYVLDNKIELVEILKNAPEDVKPFLESELNSILTDTIKQEAILGNLFYETRDERFDMLMQKLRLIVNKI